MAAEAETPDPISPTKREVEDKEFTGKFLDITANIALEEKKKVESWSSKPVETLEKIENTQADDIVVAGVNLVTKSTTEDDNFLQSPIVDDGRVEKNTEENQPNITEELSGLRDEEKDKANKILCDDVKDSCTSKETACLDNQETEKAAEYDKATKDSSVSALTEDTSSGKEQLDAGGNLGENLGMEFEERNQEIIGSSKKMKNVTSIETPLEVASQAIETNVPCEDAEKITNVKEQKPARIPEEILWETRNDETIIFDDTNKQIQNEKNLSAVDLDAEVEIPNKNSNDLDVPHLLAEETIQVGDEKKDKVSILKSEDQLNIIEKLSGLQDEQNEMVDKMLSDGVKDSCTSKEKEIACPDNQETKEAAECNEATKDSLVTMQTKDTTSGKEGLDEGGNLGENSGMEFEKGSQEIIGSSKKMKNVASTETPLEVVSQEIETNVPSEDVETITNVKEQRPVGIPEEILCETRNEETTISDDINKQIPEEKNFSTIDVNAEVKIPSKNSNDLDVPYLPVEETVRVGSEKRDEVSILESGDQLNVIEELSGLQDEEKDKAEKILGDGVKDGCTSKETACPYNHEIEEAIKCDDSEETTKDSSIIVLTKDTSPGKEGLDAGGNLGENSDIEFEEGNQEIIGSSKKMKNVTSTETQLEVASREIETNVPSEDAETITNVKEQRLVGIPEEILQKAVNDETIISDDIKKQIPEGKNLSTVDLDAEVEIPSKNNNDLDVPDVSHLPVEETVQVGGEKQDEVLISESTDQVFEGFEVPREEEKLVNKTDEASKNPESLIFEHLSTGEAANIDELVKVSELNSEEQLKEINSGDNTKEEIKQKEKAPVEMLPMRDLSTADLDDKNRRTGIEMLNENDNDMYVTYPSIEETIQVKGEKHDEVSISESGDQVDEAFRVPEEEEKNVDEANEVSESPGSSTIFEHTSTEAVNVDTLGKDCELNKKEELKEINTAQNVGEEREQKEKAANKVLHVTRSDDNEKCTFEEDVPVTNTTRLCGGEESDHHEQEYKNRPNSSEEATSESDRGDQRFKTSYETKIANAQFINNEDFEDSKTADRGEDTEQATKSEGDTITDQSPKSTSDDAKKSTQENEMEAKCKPEMGKELGITSEAGEHKVSDWNTVSAGEELQTESCKENAMTTKMPNQEVFEVLQTADGSANVGIQTKVGDGIAKDKFAAQEETKNECFHEEVKEENEPDTKVLKTNHGVQDTAEQIMKNSVNIQSADYFEEKTVVECSYNDEGNERYMAARTSMTTEESTTTDLPSSLVGDKIVKESLKEDRRNSAGSEEEVYNSNTGFTEKTLEATCSMDEREEEASKEEAKPNEGPNTQSITGSDMPNESNLDYIENSTVPEIPEKEILEKRDSEVTSVAEETILTEAETDYKMQADNSNLVSEEKDLVPAETTENGSSDINSKTKPEESSNLSENEDEENPTAIKHGAHEAEGRTEPEENHEPQDALIKTEDQTESVIAGTSTDDTVEQNIRALSVQEHKFVTAEVNEKRVEAPEKDKISFSTAKTSLVAETTEENTIEMEDESTYPKNRGLTNVDECANGGPCNNKESYPLPELNNEKNTSESDVELFKSVNTSEVANWTELGDLKTPEDEKLSDIGFQNEKSEWETEINEASKEVEGCSGGIETQMAILEREDSTENYEGAAKESIQIEKAAVELQAEGETLTSEAESFSGLPKMNIKSVEHGENPESAPESVDEDTSERRFSGTNQTNIEEESYMDETPAIDFPKEQVSGQDIQEGKEKTNEEMEPKSSPQKETKKIEDAIVCIEIERDDENEINKGQTVEEESCTKELHAMAAVENQVTELDPSATHSLEARTVNDETEMVKSKVAEDSNEELELTHEHEKEENGSITINNSDANAIETEETKIPNKVLESKDQDARDIHERSTSIPVGDADTNKIENHREDPEALSEPINQGAEAANADEIIAPPVVAEVTSLREVQLTDEPVKALETSSDTKSPGTTNTVYINQQEAEVNSMKREVEEIKIPDVEEIQETRTSLTVGETDTNENEKHIKEIPEALPEPINQGVEASGNDEIAHGQTVQFEKTEEQVKLLSSVLLSDEESVESTAIIEKAEDGYTKKDDTNAADLKVEETSGIASQLLATQFDSESNLTGEKLEAHEVNVEETKSLDSVSEPKYQGFEEIHGTWTRPTAEIINADKMEEEIKEVTEKISDPRCQSIEVVAEDQIPDRAHPVDKLEQQLQTSSSALVKLAEATSVVEFPTTEHEGADNMKAATEKLDEDEVQLEAEVKEAKTVEQISEFKVHGVEEIQETGPSPTGEKTQKEEVEEEIKAIPEKISSPNHQCDEAIINKNITPYQIPQVERKEQLQEPSFALLEEHDNKTTAKVEMIKDESTKKDGTHMNENVPDSIKTGATEKLDLQDEVSKEHEVSNLDLTEQDTQNGAPEEESTALEEVLTVKPQEYDPEIKYADSPIESGKTPVQCSSQDSSKDEEAIYSGNSNEESDNLPPHATVKELVPGEVGKKCEETPSLEFDNTKKIIEYVSEIKSPEVPSMLEGAEIKKEQLEETTTKSRDSENLSEETNEADEAMKEDTSKEKIMEEKQVLQNSRPVSPHEETVTKSNQEEDLEVECYPQERTNEKCATTRNEIQQGKLFEESERNAADKTIKETTTAKDRTVEEPDQISVGDETADISCPEEANDDDRAPIKLNLGNQRDETNFGDAATAPIKEVKSSGGMSVKPEEDKTGDNNEETEMAKGEQLQNKYITASVEARDEKTSEIFEGISVPAPKVPTHETIEMHEDSTEIAGFNTDNSESLVDHEKVEHKSLEQACEGNDITEGLNLKEKEACTNKPSISSLQEETSDRESENTMDEKQHEFMPDKQTDAASILGGKSTHFEKERTMDEEMVQISTIGTQREFDEAKTHSAMSANEDDEAQHQNEELIFLSYTKDSELSNEKDIMDLTEATEITKETQVLQETSLSISHEQIARKEDPSEGTETANSTACKDVPLMQGNMIRKADQNAEIKDIKPGYVSRSEPETKGLEYGEEKIMREECQETTEKSMPIDSATISLSELLHRSTKETLQVAEHLTEDREQMANKEEMQTKTTETAKVEEAKTNEEKSEEVEGDEHKREDSGSDAPVMVEAFRDADVKIAHKKSHNILSGVGSKVKHSIAKVKKAITGKSSHSKTPLPK